MSPAATLMFALWLSGTAPAEVTVAIAPKGYDIDISGQVTTDELLAAIAKAIGVTISGQPTETTVRENHFRSSSLERALRALLPHAAFVVSFAKNGSPEKIIFLSANKTDGTGGDAGSGAGVNPGMDSGDANPDPGYTGTPDAEPGNPPDNSVPGN